MIIRPLAKSILTVTTVTSLLWLVGCSSKDHTLSKSRQKATMRDYTVRGKRYHPTYVSVGDTMQGVASWYGPAFHGRYTSSGERYDMYDKTAAHKTWPMNTMVKVKNLDNGKSTVVRINDRGPFVSGRVIDCSYSAGKELGLHKSGTCRVKLTVLGFAGKVYKPTSATSAIPPKIKLTNFAVQVGAFRRKVGAEIFRQKYSTYVNKPQKVEIREFIEGGMPLYRVWVTGFGSEEEARDFIKLNNIDGGFVIRP